MFYYRCPSCHSDISWETSSCRDLWWCHHCSTVSRTTHTLEMMRSCISSPRCTRVTSATGGSSVSNLLLGLHPELASLTDLDTGGGALQFLGDGSITDPTVALALALRQGVRGHQPLTGHSGDTNHHQTQDDLNWTVWGERGGRGSRNIYLDFLLY